MANPDGRIPERKLLVVGPFTRPICFKKAPISEEVSRLQERIVSLEADLNEAKRCKTEAERVFQRKIVEEKLADLPSNETVLLARATLAKNELAKEQRRSKQIAAEADSRVRQKQLEMEEEMRKLEVDWRGRLERRNADVGQLKARNRWLWEELQAARNWIRRQEAPSSSRAPEPSAHRPMAGGVPRERRRETEVRIQVLERQLDTATPTTNEFNALMDEIDGLVRMLRREKEELVLANHTLMGQIEGARNQAISDAKEMGLVMESRRRYQEYSSEMKEQAKNSLLFGREMKDRAEAAEAEVQRLRAVEARREKEKITANSKVEGMDVGDAYFLGFDECKTIANLLCPGIGKDLCYPLEVNTQRSHQIGEGTRGAGTSQEPIDLNGIPPNL